jgi:hypothetical protein
MRCLRLWGLSEMAEEIIRVNAGDLNVALIDAASGLPVNIACMFCITPAVARQLLGADVSGDRLHIASIQ